MHKLRHCAIFLAVSLLAASLLGGVSLAQDTYTLQYITSVAGNPNYLQFQQGVSGFSFSPFSQTGQANVGFTNTSVSGVYNKNFSLGAFLNAGSIALLNIQPGLEVTPMTINGLIFSQGNQIPVGDYNYGVSLNFNGFQGTGLVVLNVMAGAFSNQFTSLTFNMGKNATPTPLGSVSSWSLGTANPFVVNFSNGGVLNVLQGNPTMVSISNQQMQLIVGTANNDIQMQGKQTSVDKMINGTPNVQGISAITVSAGVNNQISHNVSVNFDTAR